MRWAWLAAALAATNCGRAWQRDESERVILASQYEAADEEALDGVPEPNVPDAVGRFEPSPPMTWQNKSGQRAKGRGGSSPRPKNKAKHKARQ